MSKIKVNKKDIRKMVKESVELILENRFQQVKERLEAMIRRCYGGFPLDAVYPNREQNPHGLLLIDLLTETFLTEFFSVSDMKERPIIRLAPMVLRIAYELGYQMSMAHASELERLRKIIFYLYLESKFGRIDLAKEFTQEQMSQMTFNDLERKYGAEIDRRDAAEDDEIKNGQYDRNTDYEIIEDADYRTAHEIGQHSCPTSLLCYATNRMVWDQYTGMGRNKVYILLKPGWRDLPAVHDDGKEKGSAYDTYGLSMIFVMVAPNGKLACVNTRWNHQATFKDGCCSNQDLTRKDLSDLVHAPFDDVFKPYTREELRRKGVA